MPRSTPNPVDAFAEEAARVGTVVLALPEDAFALPTRCPPWDVRALLGHLYRDVDRILQYRDLPAGEPDADAVSYWSGYDRVGAAPGIVARAIEAADGHASAGELARAFDERWRESVAAAMEMDPARPIKTFAPTLRLDEYVKTRVLELAIHGLDLAHALGRDPWTGPRAADVTRDILVALLGSDPPPSLGWDDVMFFEAGTGRRPLTGAERDALGDRAGRFPLLA